MNSFSFKENPEKYACADKCPVRNVISRFSGKWSLLVLCILQEYGSARFNAIQKSLPDISPKVLSETLRNLESDGLISRKVYAEVPPRVEYSLTPLGESLMPHIDGLISWAVENFNLISGCENR